MTAKLPLEGYRILTIECMWAAAMATQVLADLGAEVIRLENIYKFAPGTTSRGGYPVLSKEENAWIQPWLGAYPSRDPGENPWNMNPFFIHNLRNKHSMTLDISRPEGWSIFERLVKISDVVIENNAVATGDKLGLTYEKLKAINPLIILIRMPAWGLTGPYAKRRAWGAHIDDVIGHNTLRTYRNTGPESNGQVFTADQIAGALGAFATMCALRHKRRTGKGQFVEVAQAEGALTNLTEALMDYAMNGRVAESIGNRDIHGGAPYGTYRCKGEDRWLNISVTSEKEWQGFCRALGNPPWTQEPQFADSIKRYENQDALDGYVSIWTAQQDFYEAMYLLQKHGVPAGVVMDGRDLFSNPQYLERQWLEEIDHPAVGKRLWPGMMAKYSKTPLSIRKHHVLLGEDNEYVYKKLLNVSDEEYAKLEKNAHIGRRYINELPASSSPHHR